MNTRPIFPYNSQVLQNLVLRASPDEQRPQMRKIPTPALRVSPPLNTANSIGAPFGLDSRASSRLNFGTYAAAESLAAIAPVQVDNSNIAAAPANEAVERIERSLTSLLADVVQSFAEVLVAAFERSLNEIFGAAQAQPLINSPATSAQTPGQSQIDSTANDGDVVAPPKKKKKKGGFFSKLGKGIVNFAKKGLSKLGNTALNFAARYFGFSG